MTQWDDSENPTDPTPPAPNPPPGFVLDPATGLYLGPGGNLSWDPATGQIGYPHGATPPPVTTPDPPIDGGGGGGGGTGGGGGGGTGNGFGFSQPFSAPTPTSLGGPAGVPQTPTFTPPALDKPAPFSYAQWKAPSVQDALSDPGYQFRINQGTDRLQNWAAAKGTLNDSGTAKDLIDYGQAAGSQEYQNVWNRDFGAWNTGFGNALQAYGANYGTQYLQPYQAAYQGWQAGTVNPSMTAYSTQASANQHNNDMNYLNAYNQWLTDYDIFRDKRNTTIDFASR